MKTLYCKLFGHDYLIKVEITDFVREYECASCGRQMTTSDQGNMIPLTDKRREINQELRKLYKKRKKIKQKFH